MPKVLVVDNDDAVRRIVGLLLARAGYDVILAAYRQVGYRMAQSDKPDLILLDLMMPVIDGFELLRRLKENPSTSHIPVIILTAKIDAASERECMHLGAVDYIKKPWGPRELEDRIGMALGYPELSPPVILSTDESSDDGQVDREEYPDLDQIPESPARWVPIGSGQENPENSDTDQPRKFRTRTFQVRPDEVDPSSLI
jgi:DNA-binding response OmpR family regulator